MSSKVISKGEISENMLNNKKNLYNHLMKLLNDYKNLEVLQFDKGERYNIYKSMYHPLKFKKIRCGESVRIIISKKEEEEINLKSSVRIIISEKEINLKNEVEIERVKVEKYVNRVLVTSIIGWLLMFIIMIENYV